VQAVVTEVLAGRYELGGTLGSGGMARVCEAYDRTLTRRVAVKLLHPQTMQQPGMLDRFLREAQTAASFNHPNAVAVYDTGRDDGVPYIVMELIEGPTLAAVLDDRGRLGDREASAVTNQVLAALAAAHRRGLVHRDVKPGNVLLPGGVVPTHPASEPQAKLADFGIAKGLQEAAAGLTATGQIMGTPKYVSPEQVGGSQATPRSDVYSVGVMLYEMLAGRPPFEGESAIALALAHRQDPVPPLDQRVRGLDPNLVGVVHRALEKDPARRFADAGEMRAALVDGLEGAPASGPATTLPMGAAAPTEVIVEDERPRGAWKPVVLVAVLALALLAFVAVDWGDLMDRLAPADPAQPNGDTDTEPGGDTEPEGDTNGDDPADDAAPDEAPADEEDPADEDGEGEADPPADDDDPPADDDDDPPADDDDPPGQDGDPPGQNGDPPGQSDDTSTNDGGGGQVEDEGSGEGQVEGDGEAEDEGGEGEGTGAFAGVSIDP
jgi:eukaryotic-like serine/threonine-protein kinase